MNTEYFITCYDNDNDALVPELWAEESIALLEENMVMARLVHRDFENEIATFGDTVNTRRPQSFSAKRKIDGENVTTQNARATNIAVPLDQHLHTSFIIYDGEDSKSFLDLVSFYLGPAVLSLAQQVDRIISAQMVHFLFDNQYGKLGTDAGISTLLGVREVMNVNNAPVNGRNLVLTPRTETSLLALDTFHEADKVGDAGSALRNALLGTKFGFNTFMAQLQPAPSSGSETTADTLSAAAAAGATTISLTDATGFVVGEFLTVAGDMTPQMITAVSTNDLTIWPGLAHAASSGAAVTSYDQGQINQGSTTEAAGGDGSTAGYREGWHGYITVDTGNAPEVGQIVTFGVGATTAALADALAKYVIIDVEGDTFMLDRPLEAAVADDAKVNYGPVGQFNFAFHRNAIAFVNRPLAIPRRGTGALAAVASRNGISIRVTITYDGEAQGHRVTVDLLCGVAVLDENLGAVMLS